MKRTSLMILLIGVATVFFGCEKDFVEPDLSMDDQETVALKGAKVKRAFSGICTQVLPPAIEGDNEWYDETDDWRTTGTTLWVQPDLEVFGGTTTLIVDPKNPHKENRGKWEMTWEGTMVPKDLENPAAGLDIVAKAKGVGVAGKVKGMKANWTYTMDWDGTPETFFYVVEGNIEKPQGPIKKD